MFFSASGVAGMGCLLDASPYDASSTSPATGGGGTTTSPTTGGGGAGGTTSPTTGGGGTTTSPTTGGGGTGGSGGSGGAGGTGGTGGTGGAGGTGGTGGTGPTDPTSCKEAMMNGMSMSGTVMLDIDGPGPEVPLLVYCDQVNDGGGWALVYNSVGDPGMQTTAFWNIPYANRLDVKGTPGLETNYYAGLLYKVGTSYRDDAVDMGDDEILGLVRASVEGFDPMTMAFTAPQDMGSLSSTLFARQLAGGWSSTGVDHDPAAGNCAETYANVTQHYGNPCWGYNLGADIDDSDLGAGVDYTDMGWGPHIQNSIAPEVNPTLIGMGKPTLSDDGSVGFAFRVKRISRFASW